MKITVDSKLRLNGMSPSECKELRDAFALDNPKYFAAVKYGGLNPGYVSVPQKILMGEVDRDVVSVPRGSVFSQEAFSPALYEKIQNAEIVDRRVESPIQEPYPGLQITLTEEQRKAYDEFKKDIRSERPKRPHGTYLEVLEVASGKTILAARMAILLRQKTIVFVHTQLIMNAWISDLCKMFGPEYKKEIGIIRGIKATVGPHFTLCMIQTWFRRQEMWEEWWKEFGTCICDESHLTPCTSHTLCVNQFPAKYRIGITGTPYRKDRMHPIMFLVYGRPFYSMRSKGLETANSISIDKVFEVQVETPIIFENREARTYRDHMGRTRHVEKKEVFNDNKDYTDILYLIMRNSARNRLIARKVQLALKNDVNNVALIVTHRKQHARDLKAAIEQETGQDVALLISDVGREDIREKEELVKERKIRIVVATIQLIKTGASIPSLNRLFITTPIGSKQDLEQLIGRIRRKCPGKKNARIYHFVDLNLGLCRRHYFKHAVPFYRENLKVPGFKGMYTS